MGSHGGRLHQARTESHWTHSVWNTGPHCSLRSVERQPWAWAWVCGTAP